MILFSNSIQKALPYALAFFTASAVALGNLQPACAQDESSMGYYSPGYKPITNDQFLSLSKDSPVLNLFRAELAIKGEKWAQAIVFLRKSLESYDEDIDAHKWLALCLEEKMKQEEEKDPKEYRECIREWLVVARQEKGPEKGLSFKNGVSVGNSPKMYGDEEGSMMAMEHLRKLTGRYPGRFETDKKYLAKVGKPTSEDVSGKVLNKKKKVNDDDGGL